MIRIAEVRVPGRKLQILALRHRPSFVRSRTFIKIVTKSLDSAASVINKPAMSKWINFTDLEYEVLGGMESRVYTAKKIRAASMQKPTATKLS